MAALNCTVNGKPHKVLGLNLRALLSFNVLKPNPGKIPLAKALSGFLEEVGCLPALIELHRAQGFVARLVDTPRLAPSSPPPEVQPCQFQSCVSLSSPMLVIFLPLAFSLTLSLAIAYFSFSLFPNSHTAVHTPTPPPSLLSNSRWLPEENGGM